MVHEFLSTLPMSSDSYTQKILLDNKQAIDANLVTLACTSCSDGKFILMLVGLSGMQIILQVKLGC